MKSMLRWLCAGTCVFALTFTSWGQDPQLQFPIVPEEQQTGVEVQTRGPVHEAFAQPTEGKPAPYAPIAKQPPPPVPEEPPAERPEGANVKWIPGYWGWDPDRQDFLWVSGFYRQMPVGMQFTLGHWMQTDQGWVWVSGYWSPSEQTTTPLVPPPPAPIDEVLPPAPDDGVYISGYWFYRDASYVWRPGYYTHYRANRVWINPHYVWGGPGGYVFVDGYWDYPLEDRGLLYAPVYFDQPYWLNPGWAYRPYCYVRPFGLLDSLFCNNFYGSFFFGNYYGANCFGLGFRPWFDSHYHCDPLWNHYAHEHHNDAHWEHNLQHTHEERLAGRGNPPARTLQQQNGFARQTTVAGKGNGLQNVTVASTTQVSKLDNVKLTKASSAELNSSRQTANFAAKNNVTDGKSANATTIKSGSLSSATTGNLSKSPSIVPVNTTSSGINYSSKGNGFSGDRTASSSQTKSGNGAADKFNLPSTSTKSGNLNTDKLNLPSQSTKSGNFSTDKLTLPSQTNKSGSVNTDKLNLPSQTTKSGTFNADKLNLPAQTPKSGGGTNNSSPRNVTNPAGGGGGAIKGASYSAGNSAANANTIRLDSSQFRPNSSSAAISTAPKVQSFNSSAIRSQPNTVSLSPSRNISAGPSVSSAARSFTSSPSVSRGSSPISSASRSAPSIRSSGGGGSARISSGGGAARSSGGGGGSRGGGGGKR